MRTSIQYRYSSCARRSPFPVTLTPPPPDPPWTSLIALIVINKWSLTDRAPRTLLTSRPLHYVQYADRGVATAWLLRPGRHAAGMLADVAQLYNGSYAYAHPIDVDGSIPIRDNY